jgi:hypothetical protein
VRKLWATAGLLVIAAVAMSAAASGCEDAPTDRRDQVASAADLTTRQLIAALNAKSQDALAPLVVITSTTGGPPRALRPDELERVMTPEPPFEYVGAGKPGTMVIQDGAKQKRVLRLIEVGSALRVLATNEALSAYLTRETGTAMAAPEETRVRVISLMTSAK